MPEPCPSAMEIANIQYYGMAGDSTSCLNGIQRLVLFGDRIKKAKLLTCRNEHAAHHAYILEINFSELVCIKSGFTSGYPGEGPKKFSISLQLLKSCGAEINEYEVDQSIFDRLNKSCLRQNDLESLIQPIEQYRVLKYIAGEGRDVPFCGYNAEIFSEELPATIPFGLLDSRLVDIAVNFFHDPDANLYKAFRRLETLVVSRSGLKGENGLKLFQKAFLHDDSPLHWNDVCKAETVSKVDLFKGVFGTYRNSRFHREPDEDHIRACVRELMLINELYHLESLAVKRSLQQRTK